MTFGIDFLDVTILVLITVAIVNLIKKSCDKSIKRILELTPGKEIHVH